MSYGNAEFFRRDGAGHRRVHIAHNNDEIWTVFDAHRFESHHDSSGLLSMAAGANTEKTVWLRQIKIVKENIRHVGIVMLPGMDQPSSKHFWSFI